jgi:hypothetical protein
MLGIKVAPARWIAAVGFDVAGRGECSEPLVCIPAPREEARFIRAHMCERLESVHLQLEEEVVVVQ